MFQRMKSMYRRAQAALSLALLSAYSTAYAGLPSVAAPSTGSSTNFLDVIQGYSKDAIKVVGLIIGASVFVLVVKNAMVVYAEIGDGKKKWSDLAMHTVIGGALLVVAVYLLTQSGTVI